MSAAKRMSPLSGERLLSDSTRGTACALLGSQPSPQTASAGYATTPPARIILAARAMRGLRAQSTMVASVFNGIECRCSDRRANLNRVGGQLKGAHVNIGCLRCRILEFHADKPRVSSTHITTSLGQP